MLMMIHSAHVMASVHDLKIVVVVAHSFFAMNVFDISENKA